MRGGVGLCVMVAAMVMTCASTATALPTLREDVPVPGGLAALARALGIESPEPGGSVPHLVRVIYGDPNRPPKAPQSARRRLLAYLEAARHTASDDIVSMSLPVAIWSHAVFRRPITRELLFAAVMADEAAALVAYGLAALDDETLHFVVNNPTLVTRLYEADAAVFAAFAGHLHIRDGRVRPPGGDRAIALWESLLNEQVTRPEHFIRALVARDQGRIAYLYDVIGHLDLAHSAFALGLWIDSPAVRMDRFKALAASASSAFHEWEVQKVPFSRPPHDLMAAFALIQVTAAGAPRFPSSRGVWAYAFADDGWPAAPPPDRDPDGRPIDAAWLADALESRFAVDRSVRLDQLAFGQGRFAEATAADLPNVLVALRAFPIFRMLMLTLDRIEVDSPATYAVLAEHAHRVAALDRDRAHVALMQFQGAIALVTRLVRVGTIDRRRADMLLHALADVPLDRTRGYLGGVAAWLGEQLGPALSVSAGRSFDAALLDALAGMPSAAPARSVSWEGQQYRFDLAVFEGGRLRRGLGEPAAAAIDEVLQRYRNGEVERVDHLLGEALVALSYAIDWNDARGPSGGARVVARRHDFGLNKKARLLRAQTAWALPKRVIDRGSPWRIEGSVLGLDVALAQLAMRRITPAPPAAPPTLQSNDRDTFIATLGLMNPFALTDSVRDAIVEALTRGEQRVAAVVTTADVEVLAREINMDGWRTQALRWAMAQNRQRISHLFSLTDLLYLGGGGELSLDPWGTSALHVSGCLCSQMPLPGIATTYTGRQQVGLLASAVADLNLRVAVVLHTLKLPAAMAKAVLSAALQDYVDEVQPSYPDDWLALARSAQRVSRERIEDYVAATAIPRLLMPDGLPPSTIRR